MIRPQIGDLVAVSSGGAYYYALLLTKIRLFGAPLVFAFHQKSTALLTVDEIVRDGATGFHEFVDFIWAKREDRLFRVAARVDTKRFLAARNFKNTHTTKGKAGLWFIYDDSFNEIRRTSRPSADERAYPLFHRIDDIWMCKLIDRQWTPEQDERI
jgi:hypothetical protein